MNRFVAKIKDNRRAIIPILHFLISFLWERVAFIHSDNFSILTSVARTDAISDRTELVITYILSRIFSLVIILLFWKVVFYLVDKKLKRSDLILLGIIYIVVLLAGILIFPDVFAIETDNYTNYSMAIRFLPTYWQSIYTGALYAGCLMVIPLPVCIYIFQWSFLFLTVSYLYVNTAKLYPTGYFKYIPLTLLLLPESFFLTFNAYRNNYYAVLVVFYIATIFFRYKQEKSPERVRDFLLFAVLTAFIMVWRSEGILIGVGGMFMYIIYLVRSSQLQTKKLLIVLAVTLISFVGMNKIQSMGAEKYYGQDYMILNTTDVLYSVLNHKYVNLHYDGVEEDLAAIDKVIPVQVLKELGMHGYRDYNYTRGHIDFNQTMATDEEASAYMHAYYRIILHNIGYFLETQLNSMYKALNLGTYAISYDYDGESQVQLENFVYSQWKVGEADLMAAPGVSAWKNNSGRFFLSTVILHIIGAVKGLIVNSGISLLLNIGVLLANLLILLKELIAALEQKTLKQCGFIVAILVLFAEMAVVMLFIPEGRPAYFYPVLYAGYTLLYLYLLNRKCKEE